MVCALLASVALVLPPPTTLAATWRANDRALRAAIERWDPTRPPTAPVTRLARYEQGVIRALAARPAMALRVEKQLPSIKSDVTARADLDRLAAGSPPLRTRPRVGPAAPAARLLAWYREAARRFGVRWQLLAAVNFVESAFGRVRNTSGAGAQGPMQFLPATWRVYGLGGDVRDPHDAILGAANYLAANGARRDERAALLHYNRSPLYVDAVSRYANRMARDDDAFYAYYAWRVYFRIRISR